MILAADNVDTRKLIDFLVGLKFREEVRSDCKIMPRNIPVRTELPTALALVHTALMIFFYLNELEVIHLFGHLSNYIIFGAEDIDYGLSVDLRFLYFLFMLLSLNRHPNNIG